MLLKGALVDNVGHGHVLDAQARRVEDRDLVVAGAAGYPARNDIPYGAGQFSLFMRPWLQGTLISPLWEACSTESTKTRDLTVSMDSSSCLPGRPHRWR